MVGSTNSSGHGWHSNPNLLDNWYFGNPVNQRGESVRSTAGYFIDRWRTGDYRAEVADGCIKLTNLTTFYQPFKVNELRGKRVVLSWLVNKTSGDAIRFGVRTNNWGSYGEVKEITGVYNGLVTTVADIPSDATGNIYPCIWYQGGNKSVIEVCAAKLELGSAQTLAHLENGQWVLNEIPDYGEQLRRCQRYLLKVDYATRYRVSEIKGSNLIFMIPTPVTMRASPSLIKGSGGFSVRKVNSEIVSGFEISVDSFAANCLMINAIKLNHGMTDAVIVSTSTENFLSAEM